MPVTTHDIRDARLGEHKQDGGKEARDNTSPNPLAITLQPRDPEGEHGPNKRRDNVHWSLTDREGKRLADDPKQPNAEIEVPDPGVELSEAQPCLLADGCVDRVEAGGAETRRGGVEHHAGEVQVFAPLGPVERIGGVAAGRGHECEVVGVDRLAEVVEDHARAGDREVVFEVGGHRCQSVEQVRCGEQLVAKGVVLTSWRLYL